MIETIDNAIDVLATKIDISSTYILDMLMRQGKFNIPLFLGSVFLFSICVWTFLYFVRKYRKEENQEDNSSFSIIFFFFVIHYSLNRGWC
jgi:cbb3-type cytochrome oxidase subunit 3